MRTSRKKQGEVGMLKTQLASHMNKYGMKQAKLGKKDGCIGVAAPAVSGKFQKTWDKATVKFLAKSQCSFSLVSSSAFKEYMSTMTSVPFCRIPPFRIKSPSTLSRHVTTSAFELKCSIISIINFFKGKV